MGNRQFDMKGIFKWCATKEHWLYNQICKMWEVASGCYWEANEWIQLKCLFSFWIITYGFTGFPLVGISKNSLIHLVVCILKIENVFDSWLTLFACLVKCWLILSLISCSGLVMVLVLLSQTAIDLCPSCPLCFWQSLNITVLSRYFKTQAHKHSKHEFNSIKWMES